MAYFDEAIKLWEEQQIFFLNNDFHLDWHMWKIPIGIDKFYIIKAPIQNLGEILITGIAKPKCKERIGRVLNTCRF